MTLSRHFVENWKIRVGNGTVPQVEAVMAIVKSSVRIQKGRKLARMNGEPFNTLSLFWHPDLKIVVSIDPFTNVAVSVLSEAVLSQKPKKKSPGHGNYVPMTMHGFGVPTQV